MSCRSWSSHTGRQTSRAGFDVCRDVVASPLAIEVGPLTGLNEAGPVEGMPSARTCHQAELCLAQRVAAAPARLQTTVVCGHHLTRGEITNRPEAHDERLGARQEEGAPQPIDTFADPYLTDAGIAGREGYEFGAPQVQVRSFERRQNALVRCALRHIGAAECEAGSEQWILNVSGYAERPRLTGRRCRRPGGVLEEEAMSGDMKDARRV